MLSQKCGYKSLFGKECGEKATFIKKMTDGRPPFARCAQHSRGKSGHEEYLEYLNSKDSDTSPNYLLAFVLFLLIANTVYWLMKLVF